MPRCAMFPACTRNSIMSTPCDSYQPNRVDAALRPADHHRAPLDQLLEAPFAVRLARDVIAVPGVALVRRERAERRVHQLDEVRVPGGPFAGAAGRIGVVGAAKEDREG